MIQAPSCAFVMATTTSTMPVTSAPAAADGRTRSPPGPAKFSPMHDHAGLGQRERHEHADHVKRNQRVRVAAKHDEQHGSEAR